MGEVAPLSSKFEAFVTGYLQHFNAAKAARSVGCSKASADSMGSNWLKLPQVQEEIARRKYIKSKEAKLSPEWIIERLKLVSERCMQAVPVTDQKGVQKNGLWTFNAPGALKALELLGRNFDMFSPDVVVNVDTNIDSKLVEARERLAKRIEATKQIVDITEDVDRLEANQRANPMPEYRAESKDAQRPHNEESLQTVDTTEDRADMFEGL